MKKNNKKIMAIVITIAIFAYMVYVYFSNPTGEGVHIQCVTKQILNLNCVGCGMTRFVYYCMHLDFFTALQYNFFGPLLLVLLLTIYIYFIRWSFFDKPMPQVPVWVTWVFVVFAIVYTVCRNIPYEPFAFFSPPA